MDIIVKIPEYDGEAIDVIWENESDCEFVISSSSVVIKSNAQGLLSLAKQLLYLACNNLPNGSHVHYYDSMFSQLSSNGEIIIEKKS